MTIAGGFMGVATIARMVSGGALHLSWADYRSMPNVLVEAIAIFQDVEKQMKPKKT